MRPTFVRSSGMPGPKTFNPWWGDSAVMKQRHIKQYTLSPYQMKAAPQLIRSYLFNGYRRLSAEAFYFLLPFGLGYAVYSWGNSYDAWAKSKAGHLALEGH
ncbi:cytochrome b-c1 complex subunit 8 [Amanita rubescens]|nr:cytochrome b-c1 complex subunit 8 [Amanita rubescens]